ncbi:MAG: response regulator [Oscillospiraceae bacterium]|nr:response regulator [Oscillospiraceae bacterium]MBR6431115.1 response regulator [Oscillospiraceae bacterium]
MKTILVDDELWSMLQFKDLCEDHPEIELVGEFESAADALRYAESHTVEFALLDIEMPGINGVELAKRLREQNPDVIIVFLTGHKQYLEDFINMKADYYVFKPYTREDVKDILDRVTLLSGRLKKRVRFQTLGPFLVYVDNRPFTFKREKPRELLALLVDKRGAVLTAREAMEIIWPEKDRTDTSLFRMTMARLREELKQAGIEEILKSSAKGKYLDMSLVECDLLDLLRNHQWERYNGEYMNDYSWAEETHAYLEQMYQDRFGGTYLK